MCDASQCRFKSPFGTAICYPLDTHGFVSAGTHNNSHIHLERYGIRHMPRRNAIEGVGINGSLERIAVGICPRFRQDGQWELRRGGQLKHLRAELRRSRLEMRAARLRWCAVLAVQ